MKSNKSFRDRLKITKNGKILRRIKGQNHFNAKDSGRQGLKKRGLVLVSLTQQIKRRFLPKTK